MTTKTGEVGHGHPFPLIPFSVCQKIWITSQETVVTGDPYLLRVSTEREGPVGREGWMGLTSRDYVCCEETDSRKLLKELNPKTTKEVRNSSLLRSKEKSSRVHVTKLTEKVVSTTLH